MGSEPDRVVLSTDEWAQLDAAGTRYASSVSPFYDEVLDEVVARAEQQKSLGKADIGALLLWKRLRGDSPAMKALLVTPNETVRAATGESITAARDQAFSTPEAASRARSALSPLPGFARGDALASAVIVAANPARFAVYDRRAHHGLASLGIALSNAPGRYSRYMDIVGQVVEQSADRGDALTPRQVDLALFTLEGPPEG